MTAVIVTTDKDRRGVFFGHLPAMPAELPDNRQITLADARMIIYWPSGGVIGLAGDGPPKGTRYSPACKTLLIDGVVSISECTEEAVAKWSTA